MQITVLRIGLLGQPRSNRADHAVAQQDAQERADQRGCDFLPDLFRWSAQRAHGNDHPEHGRYDAESRKSIGNGTEGMDRLHCLVVGHLHVALHHLVHVERLDPSRDCGAQRVAQEGQRVMVAQKRRIPFEYLALHGLLDVVLDADEALLPHLVAQLKQHPERLQVSRPAELRRTQSARHIGQHGLDDGDRIRDQHGSQGRTHDGYNLRWLDEDQDVPLFHQKAGDDSGKDDNNSNDREH